MNSLTILRHIFLGFPLFGLCLSQVALMNNEYFFSSILDLKIK